MSMRIVTGAVVATIAVIAAGAAGAADLAGTAPLPKVVYGTPPGIYVVPPTGYVLNPSDAVPPVYPVDPGFYGPRFVPLARPTYSEGGYAYADAYPYDAPYIHSYGAGLHYRYRAWRVRHHAYDGFARPFGAPPYAAYRYQTAPSARIIQVPPAE